MDKLRNGIIFGIVLFFVVVTSVVFIVASIKNYDGGTKKYFAKSNTKIGNELSEIIETQKEQDEIIRSEISKIKEYTVDKPMIIKDPYKMNSLSALILFYTDEELELDIYINNGYMSTVKASKEHILPIYGLHNNQDNIVRLEFSNGYKKEYTLNTYIYNDFTEGYNLTNSMNGSQFIFLVGDRNNVESKLRGFDQKGILSYYFDLDYITSALIHTDSVYVGYNSKYNKNNNVPDLKIQMDYLGKILSIATDTTDLLKQSNVDLANIDYLTINQNVYQDYIDNYEVKDLVDNNPTTQTGVTSVDELALYLQDAEDFQLPYVLSINNKYLTYDFKGNKDIIVLAVSRSGNVYNYNADETSIIKLPDNKEYSLYVKYGNKYYNLKTIITE